MANEISLSVYALLKNGSLVDGFNPGQQTANQVSARRAGYTQNLTSAEEVLDFGDVSNPGLLMLTNLDATNHATAGPVSSGAMVPAIDIPPGMTAGPFFVYAGAVWKARAEVGTSDATVNLDVKLWSL